MRDLPTILSESWDIWTIAPFSIPYTVWIYPSAGYFGNRYPNKRFIAERQYNGNVRYFRNRRKAERWARRFTDNIRHL